MLSLLLLFQASAFDPHPLAKPFDLNEAQKTQIREAVGEELKDPFSAQYDWKPVYDEYIYCGRVNSKNSYGAYTGYKLFAVLYAKTKSGRLFIGPGAVSLGDEIAIKMCETVVASGTKVLGN